MRAAYAFASAVLLIVAAVGRQAASAEPAKPRVETAPHRPWAVKLEAPGLKNFHRVTPNLYRCAQPGREGMLQLEKFGVKTVICLRGFHDDDDEVRDSLLKTEHISFNTWHPEDDDVVRFLKIITATKRGPFAVHCQHGSDRTGTMVAICRMAVQGWTKDEAIAEMTQGGFGFHPVWKNLIRYLRALDVDAVKKRAGVK